LRFQHLGHRRFVGVQPDGAGVIERALLAQAIGVTARHQRSARRRTHGLRNVKVGEFRAFFRQPVEVGCANVWVSERRDVAVTQIIDEDQDDVRPDVWTLLRRTVSERTPQQQGKKTKFGFHGFSSEKPWVRIASGVLSAMDAMMPQG
jgi:hypothetical protein